MTTRRRRDLNLTESDRPISAIYIGKDPLQLQRTPDPALALTDSILESPPPSSASRVQRQLPSPPVTLDNRSTGDSASSHAGTLGRKSNVEVVSQSQFQSQSDNNDSKMSAHEDDDDDDHDHDLDHGDEDNTAKLSGDLKPSQPPSTLHPGGALARVKSLAERNRELTRRLSTLSRRDTPSPIATAISSSAIASTSTSSSSIAATPHTSRLSWGSFSGSETEREPISATSVRRLESIPSVRRSLDSRRDSPPPRTPSPPPNSSLNASTSVKPAIRRRRTSVDLTQDGVSKTLSRATTRVSRTSTVDSESKDETPATTIGRSSPLNTGRRQRQPLPYEFRESLQSDRTSSSDMQSLSLSSGRSGRASPRLYSSKPASDFSRSTLELPTRTSRTSRPSSRSATVREVRQSPYHQRTESEHSSSRLLDDAEHVGRRASVRGGSADSIIGQRSVVGESLRAAGLAREREEDVFSAQSGWQGSRRRLSGDIGSRPQLSQVHEVPDDKKPRQDTEQFETVSTGQRIVSRPSTSMAMFQSSERSPRGQPWARSKTVFLADRERTSPMVTNRHAEYAGSTRNVYTPPTPSHRKTGRNSSMRVLDKSSLSTPASEHAKLMLDSLSMFESHLARLPIGSNASLSATTIPDLYHNAQTVVQAANTLNVLIREANTHALEEQIEAEIREGSEEVDVSEIWRSIGSEYRETLRVSDELVRTMTGFLLGMGKILREAASLRETHVDEEGRVNSPIGSHGSHGSATGRRSNDGRRSLDFPVETSPRERERYREESLRRIATQSSARAPSVLDTFRQPGSEDERGGESTERPSKSAISGLSVRRMFSVKAGRPKSSPVVINPKIEDIKPAVRSSPAIPPPLETIPSETLLQRSPRTTRYRRGTVTSTNKTVFPSFFSSSQPTTAITPTTVTNSPEKSVTHLQRTISASSGALFSKSTGSAADGLLRQFDTDTRMRSASTSSAVDHERMAAVISPTDQGEDRVFRASFDGHMHSHSTVQKGTYSDRKDRRRTVTEVFSRAN